MKIIELIEHFEKIFPLNLQEDYDNSGSQILFHENDIESIYISLDLDDKIIENAIDNGCNLILTHHPFIFKSIKKISSEDYMSRNLIKLIDNRISVYSIHTNLDRVYHKKLSETLEMEYINSLILEKNINDENSYGFGSLSELKDSISLENLLMHVKKKLNLNYLIYNGDLSKKIKRVGLLNGAGGNSIGKIIKNSELDCIITGDVGYHNSKFAEENGIAVIDAGHFGTEIIFINFLYKETQDFLTNKSVKQSIKVIKSMIENNPLSLYI